MLLGLRAVLLAILDFARIASALVVVVGVTSHLGSGAALSPRRCRIASVGAHNRTEMLRLRGVLLTNLKERKKENIQPKGGMGGRHAATTQGF